MMSPPTVRLTALRMGSRTPDATKALSAEGKRDRLITDRTQARATSLRAACRRRTVASVPGDVRKCRCWEPAPSKTWEDASPPAPPCLPVIPRKPALPLATVGRSPAPADSAVLSGPITCCDAAACEARREAPAIGLRSRRASTAVLGEVLLEVDRRRALERFGVSDGVEDVAARRDCLHLVDLLM